MSALRAELFDLLKDLSVTFGEFTLKSGGKSNFYIDCRKTSFHSHGAFLIGKVMHPMIRQKAEQLGTDVTHVGGMTMGADPIALSIALRSELRGESPALHAFSVRKAAKEHGTEKRIEGCFEPGITVALIEDVITTGGSTLSAIEAVEAEGGKVAFVACLVERQEGGRKAIEGRGYPVLPVFNKSEFIT